MALKQNAPEGQRVHTPLPARAYVPEEQRVGMAVLEEHEEPAGHVTQATRARSLYVPASHAVHIPAMAADTAPDAHVMGAPTPRGQ